MVRSKLGLKALGLCALVLGLMAFASSAAQAEKGAHWNIINSAGTLIQVNEANKLFAQLEIKEIENKTAELLFTTKSGTKVAILCTTANFDAGGLLLENGGISLGKILFKGCLTKLNGTTQAACKPKGGGAPLGEILTESGEGLIVLDVGNDLVKIKPDTGKLFVTISLGEECSIGSSVPVEAKELGEGLWLKDSATETKTSNEQFLNDQLVEHLIQEALNGLIALGQPATIDGKAFVRLAGAHLGLKWGGTPA